MEEKLATCLGAVCSAVLGIPLAGFVIAPLFRKVIGKWISVGKVGDFKIGKTVSVTFEDTSPLPWAGITAKTSAWLRRRLLQGRCRCRRAAARAAAPLSGAAGKWRSAAQVPAGSHHDEAMKKVLLYA